MKAVVQRVSEARVRVAGETVAEIGAGLCVLLGVAETDDADAADRLAGRIARLRVFENEDGKFDRSVLDLGVPVQTGIFGARMEVALVNDGPVTIILEVESRS